MKVFKLAAGLAIGYVVGSRAGRDKYEQIVAAARKAQNHPAMTQAQQKAKEMLRIEPSTGSEPAATPAVSAAPVPRPPRRRTTSVVTVPDTAVDPLA